MTAGAGWLAVEFEPINEPCARDHANDANEISTSRAVSHPPLVARAIVPSEHMTRTLGANNIAMSTAAPGSPHVNGSAADR